MKCLKCFCTHFISIIVQKNFNEDILQDNQHNRYQKWWNMVCIFNFKWKNWIFFLNWFSSFCIQSWNIPWSNARARRIKGSTYIIFLDFGFREHFSIHRIHTHNIHTVWFKRLFAPKIQQPIKSSRNKDLII